MIKLPAVLPATFYLMSRWLLAKKQCWRLGEQLTEISKKEKIRPQHYF